MSITASILSKGKVAKGRKELIRFLKGEPLTYKQAIRAKCYECMGWYTDGKVTCGIKKCPLFPFMPFKDVEVKE